MHLHTDSVILPFSVSCVPVTVAGRGSSAAPTWRGINGVAVVEATHPRSCDGVLACFNLSLLVLLELILISVWLNQLGHAVCVYFWVNVCLQLWGLVLCFYNGVRLRQLDGFGFIDRDKKCIPLFIPFLPFFHLLSHFSSSHDFPVCRCPSMHPML